MNSGSGDRWWRRLTSRLFGGRQALPLDPDRTDLVVVASSFDDAEACSATLDRAAASEPRWSAPNEAVFRHHLLVPAHEVEDAVAVAAQDGYSPSDSGPPAQAVLAATAAVSDAHPLVLRRVQILDALHCSQERSRMAGLAQRRGGVVLGWDALQPVAPTEQTRRTD